MLVEELRELCDLVVSLTRLRLNECKNLAIENFAPELLGKLIREHMTMRQTPDVKTLCDTELKMIATQAERER